MESCCSFALFLGPRPRRLAARGQEFEIRIVAVLLLELVITQEEVNEERQRLAKKHFKDANSKFGDLLSGQD